MAGDDDQKDGGGVGEVGEVGGVGEVGEVDDVTGDNWRRRQRRWLKAREAFLAANAAKVARGWFLLSDWIPFASNSTYDRFAARFAKENGFQDFLLTPIWGARPVRLFAHSPAIAVAAVAAGLASKDGPASISREALRELAALYNLPALLWFETSDRPPEKKRRRRSPKPPMMEDRQPAPTEDPPTEDPPMEDPPTEAREDPALPLFGRPANDDDDRA